MAHSIARMCFLALLLLFSGSGCEQQAEKMASEDAAHGELQLEGIPQAVMEGLRARFPDAEIQEWTREEEGDIVVYDFEFTQGGIKFEADIKEDGSIHNWEKAIEIGDLPEVLRQAAEMKYPHSTIKEIMEITAIVDGKEALEAYEIVLETADMKEIEIAVAPDGQILEDSGEMVPEER